MHGYKNGNYKVIIFDDGTKVRMTEDDEFIPAFSENCDVKITDKCNMGCSFCFPAGTPIVTKNGIKNIEDIVEGDLALSFNENFNGDEYACVTQLFKHRHTGNMIKINVGASSLICTSNHKIYVKYNNSGINNANWIEAKDIEITNDTNPSVRTDGGWFSIDSIELIENFDDFVYNIGVEHNHNYYAGNGHILVHNCYEGCTSNGKHADLMKYTKLIDSLHPYTEMALNGNDLDIPNFEQFLEKLKEKKVFANITVHQYQFMKNFDYIKSLQDKGLIHGIGVSLANSTNIEFVQMLGKVKNTVLHVINGLFTETDYNNLKDQDLKILFLGYKHLRRGDDYYSEHSNIIEHNIEWLRNNIMDITKHFKVTSFDNLSLNQLDVQSKMDPAKWEEFYMGDDGGFTFYIDLVAGTFSKNSISMERYEIGDKTIDEMFDIIHKKEVAAYANGQ